MDARKILQKETPLTILLDTSAFNDLLTNDQRANSILDYTKNQDIKLIRTDETTPHKILDQIPKCQLIKYENQDEIWYFKIETKNGMSKNGFWGKKKQIEAFAKHVYQKEEITSSEFENITKIFIQSTLNFQNNQKIMITNDERLLINRYWFENRLATEYLNIMTLDEASNYIDLFFKYREKYLARSFCHLNRGMLYWHSMRLKLPYYHVGDDFINALGRRYYYALMAVDYIGIQHYLGSNNDTIDMMLYHMFNLISFTSGIFDNLALKTNLHFDLKVENENWISLNRKDFLKKIRCANSNLRDFITNYIHFIRLIYCIRPQVIHRELFQDTSVGHKDGEFKCFINAFITTPEVKFRLSQLGDTQREFDIFSEWGYYEMFRDSAYLEPYHFSKKIVLTLKDFINGYLPYLGYTSFHDNVDKSSSYYQTMSMMQKYYLGI